MAAAAALALCGEVTGGYIWSARSVTELSAFALVAWTWWYLVRHGLPQLIDKFLDHLKQLEAAHRDELDQERQQRRADTERMINALAAINDTVRETL